jgi:glycosyltransferase involved in cell wall biosynthesis
MRILFYTESLIFGGKERRLLELIKYLKENTDHNIALVISEPIIQYEYAHKIGIPITIIKRRGVKYDPVPFIRFYKYCRVFKPDLIHTWGKMTTFYAIPSKLLCKVPLISSMIADSRKNFSTLSFDNIFFKSDILFSDVILSNSRAGLKAYNITSPKAKVILNGVHLERFQQKFEPDKVKEEFGIKTEFIIAMVAAFTLNKDYDLFLEISKEIGKIRDDVTFIGVGDGPEWKRIRQKMTDEEIYNVILVGKQNGTERIISASDIGLLCTYSEGISNSIIEYMALEKPVISTDTIGGSNEIILEGITGYCTERNTKKIVSLINLLLNNAALRNSMGIEGKKRINSDFSIDRMGTDFLKLYNEIRTKKVRKADGLSDSLTNS